MDKFKMDCENESLKRPLPSTDEESDDKRPSYKTPRGQNNQREKTSRAVQARESGSAQAPSSTQAGSSANTQPGVSLVKEESPKTYGSFVKPPFVVHVRLATKEKTSKRMSILTVAKKLRSANVKFIEIHQYTFNTWKVICTTKNTANLILTNKYVTEAGLVAFIPGYKLSRRFVVQNIPLEISLQELKEAIADENTGISPINLFRLKRKNRITGLWEESEAVCVQKLGEEVPEKISIFHTINTVKPYCAPIRLCFKCGFFGHLAKFCTRDPKCLQCSSSEHQSTKTNQCQVVTKKCINCGGDHATTDRRCKFYIRNSEIAKMMAWDNLPYYEAKAAIIKHERRLSENPPVKSQKNFPSLPQKRGISLVNSSASNQLMSKGEKLWSHLSEYAPEVSSRTSSLLERLLKMEDLDALLDRLENTMKLHVQDVQRKNNREKLNRL